MRDVYYFSAFLRSVFHHLSYNPHSVRGTWTIIVTAILFVVSILLLLRWLLPVQDELLAPMPRRTDERDEPAAYLQEARQYE